MISVEALLERRPDVPEETAQSIIDAATAVLQRALGYYLGELDTFEEYLIGTGSDLLMLSDTPQTGPDDYEGVTEVRVYEAQYRGAEEEEIDDFVVRGRRVYRIYPYGWTCNHEFRFVFWRGYATDEGPPDWREAILQMSLLLWQEAAGNDEGVIGLSGETLGDYSWQARADSTDFGRLPAVANVLRLSKKAAIAYSPR